MTKIKILLCALALTGCSAAIQPSFDGGPDSSTAADGSWIPDGATGCPDTIEACASIPLCLFACHYDAGADPDLGPELDAGLEPDAGTDLGTEPDGGPAPVPACGWAISTPVVLCADDRCCLEGCQPDGTCRFGHAASRSFCTCDHVTCPAGGTTCDAGLVGVCACP